VIAEILSARGVAAVLDAKGAVRLPGALIKRISHENLHDQAFVVTGELPGLVVRRDAQTFELEGELYQIITLDPALTPSDDPLACLGITALYTHHRSITMLRPPLDIDALARTHHTHKDTVKSHGHPAGPAADLRPVVDAFFESMRSRMPRDASRFRTGFAHEDLQTGNVLHGQGALHLIDLDPILSTYSVFNLAHFVAMEVVAKQQPDALAPLRAHFIGVLEEETAGDFDFFVMLAIFRALVRRAFHRDYYSDDWANDLLWIFREEGVKKYLERVP